MRKVMRKIKMILIMKMLTVMKMLMGTKGGDDDKKKHGNDSVADTDVQTVEVDVEPHPQLHNHRYILSVACAAHLMLRCWCTVHCVIYCVLVR